jgi:LacI family transcriptional regulator
MILILSLGCSNTQQRRWIMVTIYDVACLAGVKKSTVSNVINNKVVVRKETQERVLAAMAELNYVPCLVARRLKPGKTFVLALIVPMVTNPFYSEIIEVVEQVAERHGYHLLPHSATSEPSFPRWKSL